MYNLQTGSYWRILKSDPLSVDDLINSQLSAFYGPTFPVTEVDPPKLMFAEEPECSPFVHGVVTTKYQPSGKLNKLRGIVVYVLILIEKGRPKDAFLWRRNFPDGIHPEDRLRAYLPNEREIKCEVSFSTDECASFTNRKEMITNVGQHHKNKLHLNHSQHGKYNNKLLCTHR